MTIRECNSCHRFSEDEETDNSRTRLSLCHICYWDMIQRERAREVEERRRWNGEEINHRMEDHEARMEQRRRRRAAEQRANQAANDDADDIMIGLATAATATVTATTTTTTTTTARHRRRPIFHRVIIEFGEEEEEEEEEGARPRMHRHRHRPDPGHTARLRLRHFFREQINVMRDTLGERYQSRAIRLTSEEIARMPTTSINEAQVENDNQCTVCIESFELKERVSRLDCQHCFHKGCITPWLLKANTCPVCRAVVDPEKWEITLD